MSGSGQWLKASEGGGSLFVTFTLDKTVSLFVNLSTFSLDLSNSVMRGEREFVSDFWSSHRFIQKVNGFNRNP